MFGIMPWRRERKGELVPRAADPFGLMRREFDTLFDRFFGRWPLAAEGWEKPAWGLEVLDEGKDVMVRAEAPGFDVADFDVRVTGDVLTITAEHKETKEKGEKNGSRTYARLERVVTLPASADTEKAEASYRNGVLELHFPRLPEAEGKKIEVKA
jgi:HSP20 family protein